MQEKFPGKLDAEGVIVYKGDISPNLHATCDASIFKELVKSTERVNGKKKRHEMPNIYHIVFDEENKVLKAIAGDIDNVYETVKDEVHTVVSGNGTVHYANCFPEVMNVLSGDISLFALDSGPLWIEQKENKASLNVHYLIPPAIVTN